MSYLSDFERSFSEHTLQIVKSYSGPYDATLMVNSLLGLLVVPKETFLKAIPESPLTELPKWGISQRSIICSGNPGKTNPKPDTLRGLVINLRHAVAHFCISPILDDGSVTGFRYTNTSGLIADISLTEMKTFVEKLSNHLSKQ